MLDRKIWVRGGHIAHDRLPLAIRRATRRYLTAIILAIGWLAGDVLACCVTFHKNVKCGSVAAIFIAEPVAHAGLNRNRIGQTGQAVALCHALREIHRQYIMYTAMAVGHAVNVDLVVIGQRILDRWWIDIGAEQRLPVFTLREISV